MALANSILMYGDRADQPAAGPENDGCYFRVEDEGDIVEQSDGATWTQIAGGSGAVVQVVNTQTGAVATGSTVIPFDDTIPQNTEGDEYMTLAITPTNASHKLRIDVVLFFSSSINTFNACAALFQDSTASALACGYVSQANASFESCISFSHYMTAGTASATTFKVRLGMDGAGAITVNGFGGTTRRFGGVLASSITITEIVP